MSTFRTYGATFLGLLFAGVANFASASSVDALRAFTRDLKSLQGTFSQQTYDAQGKPGKTLAGTFDLAQGGRFRFDYERPFKQVLVSDGTKFSSYDADLAQMTVRSLNESLAATPLAVLTGQAEIDTVFTLKPLPDEDNMSWVAATAKQTDAAVTDLRFGFQAGQLRALAWRDNFGKRTVMRFSAIKRNAAVEPARFNFVAPAGTDIVGK